MFTTVAAYWGCRNILKCFGEYYEKKLVFCMVSGGVLVACALSLLLVSCGGGGGGGSDDDDVTPVAESGSTDVAGSENTSEDSSSGSGSTGSSGAGSTAMSVSNGITGSEVFIDGRTVTIWATWCSDHEVTQAEYELHCNYSGSQPNSTYGDGDNYPAYYVSWYDAITYCNKRSLAENLTPCYKISGKTDPDEWGSVPTTSSDATWNAVTCDFSANGYRLPTEAEWEYFARGGNITNNGQTTYSGSDDIDSVAWYCDNSSFTSHEVKLKVENALHLYDMSGNVFEWCWDWHDSISVTSSSSGALFGSSRVCRGGGFYLENVFSSVAYRVRSSPDSRSFYLGFRVVRTVN